jgi:hypothetical protein
MTIAKAVGVAACEVAVEVVDAAWLYQTTIDTFRVTVRHMSDVGGYVYIVKAEQEYNDEYHELCVKFHDIREQAVLMADLLRDIYYHKLDSDLLWH